MLYRSLTLTVLFLVFSNTACVYEGEEVDNGAGASSSASSGSGGGSKCASSIATPTLPGVHLEFTSTKCVFTLAEAAAGIQIDYRIIVDEDILTVVPKPQDDGGCGQPGPSGLIVFEDLSRSGSSDRYCLCDVGLCPAGGTPVTLKAGTYESSFLWDGRNWTGPSDFGNPKGEPFPPGEATLVLSARGEFDEGGTMKGFAVDGKFAIFLVP